MAALRQCVRSVVLQVRGILHQKWTSRGLSSASGNIILDMDSTKGVATMKLNKKPVNSLNLEFLNEIVSAVDTLEKDKGCRGLILTSNNPGIFSAGLDIMELYEQKEDRLREFWGSVQEIWLRLYGSNLITMAAINGHSPAGGCLIALTTDYRVMAAGHFTIGLNETLLGFPAPTWLQRTMKNTIGQREAEWALQLGHMYPGENALMVGLIDQLVPDNQLMSTTHAEMDRWLQIPDVARQATKLHMRKSTHEYLSSRRKEDVDSFVTFVTNPVIQNFIRIYLEGLKKKAAK